MKKAMICVLTVVLFLAFNQVTSAQAKKKDDEMKLKVKGVYTAWFQKQQDFFFGKTNYNDNYVVQMLRLHMSFAFADYVKAVTRFDMAQGWWGVDNTDFRTDFTDAPNLSSRFSNKDTNYNLHVDIGYLDFLVPNAPFPIDIRVGRMYYVLGNKLVLDSNFDGIQVDFKTKSGTIGLNYAKVSEGRGGFSPLSDNDNSSTGGADGDDADLIAVKFNRKTSNLSYGLFGMYYNDRGDDAGSTFILNGLDYAKTRFSPNISTLGAFGVTADYVNKGLGLKIKGEFDYLNGKDHVANTNSGTNQLSDVNNGDLNGYNLYLKGTKAVGPKVDVGVTFGLGSGDDNLAGGSGNVNKLKTMGFFYITELWEDSIMPDEEGITPQGLGAPNTRGYRELENSTIIQGSLLYKVAPKLKFYGSYSLIRATNDIHGWGDTNGDGVIETSEFSPQSSKTIGSEFDVKIDYSIYKQLVWSLRGGYLIAGDGAQLLINGNTNNDNNPWEAKMTITFKF